MDLKRNFDSKSCLKSTLSAIDEANTSVAGCYSDMSTFGQTNYEYPSLDDSFTYANMYDTLLRDYAQMKYYQNNYDIGSPATPVYNEHFAPVSSRRSTETTESQRRENSCPNRKSRKLDA